MDERAIKLTLLALLSAALCVVALVLVYDRLIETFVFAGLTFCIVALALALPQPEG